MAEQHEWSDDELYTTLVANTSDSFERDKEITHDQTTCTTHNFVDESDSEENIPLNKLREMKRVPHDKISSDSEDSIPLKTLSNIANKRKYHEEAKDDEQFDDDVADKDFVIKKEDFPSSDSNLSDIDIPVIDIPKHRKKWFRKRNRPF